MEGKFLALVEMVVEVEELARRRRLLRCFHVILHPANPAGQMEKLVFFFCAASLTSRDGWGGRCSRFLTVEFWVTAQPLAIAGFALAVRCQFRSCDILRWAFRSQPTSFPSHLTSAGA